MQSMATGHRERGVPGYVLDLNKIANDIRLWLGTAHGPCREMCCRRCSREHQAWEGEPVDCRDGEPGVLPGHRPRHHGGHGVRGGTAGAQRDDAGHPHNIVFGLSSWATPRERWRSAASTASGRREAMRLLLERSPALVTALAPKIGYAESAKWRRKRWRRAHGQGVVTKKQLLRALSWRSARPAGDDGVGRPGGEGAAGRRRSAGRRR